jgi:lipoprotein signal peptidase
MLRWIVEAAPLSESAYPKRWVRVTSWFLAITYGVGAPLTIFYEYRDQTFSERFNLPSLVIYATGTIQIICAFGILRRATAMWSAAALTVITIGAIGAHLRIGSPMTAVPALAYTAIQVWVGYQRRTS